MSIEEFNGMVADLKAENTTLKAEVARLTKRLSERRTDIEQMLCDTFKETMAIYGAAGGKMGDTLADNMALRLGQFIKDAKKFLKKDVRVFLKEKPAAAPQPDPHDGHCIYHCSHKKPTTAAPNAYTVNYTTRPSPKLAGANLSGGCLVRADAGDGKAAPGDICECGHHRSSHASGGTGVCLDECFEHERVKCTEFKAKGSESREKAEKP